jgi:4-hydroxybenzoate polyprenyltransferase
MPATTPKISDFFSLVKISHTIFSLPFALIGFSLAIRQAGNGPDFRLLLLVLLCIFFARNAAMGFNRFADREFDKKNPRTALREIPKNIIHPNSALLFVILNAALFMGASYFINKVCFLLSPVALLVVLGYSFTKRFTFFSHLVLGLGLALAPIGAYIAVASSVSFLPVLFSLVVIFWVSGFDILYALLDVEFDRDEDLHSVPESFGNRAALIVSLLLHVLSIAVVVAAGIVGNFSWLYWIGSMVFTLILIYEHMIVKPYDLSKVNMAFATLNGFASVIFAVFVIADLFLL